MSRSVDVNLPTDRYRIHIEPGLLGRAGAIVAEVAPHDLATVVIDENVRDAWAEPLVESLQAAGYSCLTVTVTAEESRKTLATVEVIYQQMIAAKRDRQSPVIALGGGFTGDVAGFAAATYMRGVPFAVAPTTLLAMVDASVGGKTGVNFPVPADNAGDATLGKNLIGAFWQPRTVLIDPTVLSTLSGRDFRCGLAECVKHAMLTDEQLLTFIENRADAIAALDTEALTNLIDRSVRIKAAIVEEDEREAGRRALLNLGHTFAHVIEPIQDLDLHHGEAVSIGLCAAMHCSLQTGRLRQRQADRVTKLLARLSLPTALPDAEDVDRLIGAMGYDKKVARGKLRLVLPIGLGRAEVIEDVPQDVIASAWRAVGAR